jgi:hypothetical protein
VSGIVGSSSNEKSIQPGGTTGGGVTGSSSPLTLINSFVSTSRMRCFFERLLESASSKFKGIARLFGECTAGFLGE